MSQKQERIMLICPTRAVDMSRKSDQDQKQLCKIGGSIGKRASGLSDLF